MQTIHFQHVKYRQYIAVNKAEWY